MAIHKLNAGRIAKLTKNGMYGDGGNLWLQVTSNGAGKSWLFRWTERVTGRERVMGLGPLHTVNLEEARELALGCRKLLLQGRDPKKERDDRILDDQIAHGLARTVRQVVDEFDNDIIAHHARNTKITMRRSLRIVNRTIGDMPIAKVNRQIILDKVGLAELWVTKTPTGEHLQRNLAQVFGFAIDKGYIPTGYNPALWEHLKRLLPKRHRVHKTEHRHALNYKDIPRFMEKLRAYRPGGNMQRVSQSPLALLVQFMILAGGIRPGEAREARWGEFDLEQKIWNVPPEHLKSGRKHGEVKQIPISEHMFAVLEQAKQIAYPKTLAPITTGGWQRVRPPRRFSHAHVMSPIVRPMLSFFRTALINHSIPSLLRASSERASRSAK